MFVNTWILSLTGIWFEIIKNVLISVFFCSYIKDKTHFLGTRESNMHRRISFQIILESYFSAAESLLKCFVQ